MLNTTPKYHYSDIMIQPAKISNINSRSECNPEIDSDHRFLPIFTAPMSSIVTYEDLDNYRNNGILPILPRNIDINKRLDYCHYSWSAFSLKEFKDYFLHESSQMHAYEGDYLYVCIDVANGHMKQLYDLVRSAKKIYGNTILIMTGNIANPETIIEADEAGVDYIRVGIGAGEGCITSSNTGIHYPMASLIEDTFRIKDTYKLKCKIIADGGIRNYSDIIKALALGADYVMIGGLFGKCFDIGDELYINNGYDDEKFKFDKSLYQLRDNRLYDYDETENPLEIYRKFYGMASKEGQESINGCKTKTSEGISKIVIPNTTLDKWVDNLKSYMRSAMSYCGIKDIKDFNPLNVNTIVVSNSTKESINK